MRLVHGFGHQVELRTPSLLFVCSTSPTSQSLAPTLCAPFLSPSFRNVFVWMPLARWYLECSGLPGMGCWSWCAWIRCSSRRIGCRCLSLCTDRRNVCSSQFCSASVPSAVAASGGRLGRRGTLGPVSSGCVNVDEVLAPPKPSAARRQPILSGEAGSASRRKVRLLPGNHTCLAMLRGSIQGGRSSFASFGVRRCSGCAPAGA